MLNKKLVVFLLILSLVSLGIAPAVAVPAPPGATPPPPPPAAPAPQAPEAPQPPQPGLPPSPADQALANEYAQLTQVKDQINVLDKELEQATEAYNLSKTQLEQTQRELEKVRLELKETKEDYDKQVKTFRTRINKIYKEGNSQVLELLLDTQDFADFVLRIHFLVTLTKMDAEKTKKLRSQKEKIKQTEKELDGLRTEQLTVTMDLDQKRVEVETKLAERAVFLQNIDQRVKDLLGEENRQLSSEQQDLVQRILQNTGDLGINARPGSVVDTALQYLGIPYLWGSADPKVGLDCSGFTMNVYARHGVKLIQYSRTQYAQGTKVPLEEIIPGDLVFFGNPIHHVGMYIGAGYFIHSPKTGDFVKISRLSGYPEYAGAVRYPLINRF
ncbi:MAG TPA: NlpC/P60 family protein [Candidatus Subteraquimicrobiales bacterium]